MSNLSILLRLVMTALVAGTAGVASADPSNRGGALLLHVESDAPYEYGTQDHCHDLKLPDPAQAVVRMPGDGTVRVVGVYAVFSPDSVGQVKAISFGVRYDENVRVVGQGECSGGGLEINLNGWPASQGGTSFSVMPEAVQKGRIIPLCWFALSCRGKGTFEVIPHPMPKFGGRFVNTEVPPVETPIVDYGRIGFDQDGYLASPGPTPPVGASCVNGECWLLTRRECAIYHGVWLGENADCENEPCRDDARLGGCCVAAGCDTLSALDCAKVGGYFLGEGVPCGKRPCPADSMRTRSQAR